ncbi:hypothetical protein [Nitrosospira sp. Nsp13]|uniref:hypothetical protein n=1 Tax=Nitrosospira sp. Nsp13 TaxID=1855332 RepID=UPI0008895775|nr:hypothetical protein [Nitrosospira sp. Nsp13]SCY54246.1 hypothetical protein SAMN05216308_11642 [Nitrosospira sp. Nsp13]
MSKYYLTQSFESWLSHADDEKQMGIIGRLERFQDLDQSHLVTALQERHAGIICLLLFHPDLHKEFASFVEAGGPDICGGRNICFLYISDSVDPPIALFTPEQACAELVVADKSYDIFEFVSAQLGINVARVGYPGYLFFTQIGVYDSFVYVPATKPSNSVELGQISAIAFNDALEAMSGFSTQWGDRFGLSLAKHGLDYVRSGKQQPAEFILNMLHRLWRARKDLGLLIRVGAQSISS